MGTGDMRVYSDYDGHVDPITFDVDPVDCLREFPFGFAEKRIRRYPGLFEWLDEKEEDTSIGHPQV